MPIVSGLPSPPPKWSEEVFNISGIVSNTITTAFSIWDNSQFIFVNGLAMTNGNDYDYTMTDQRTIVFNSNVLTQSGHVLVKYTYK